MSQRDLFDFGPAEPPSAAELIRRQREAVIDYVREHPAKPSHLIAEALGISGPDTLDRIREARLAGDIHRGPGCEDAGGWWPGPGREKG